MCDIFTGKSLRRTSWHSKIFGENGFYLKHVRFWEPAALDESSKYFCYKIYDAFVNTFSELMLLTVWIVHTHTQTQSQTYKLWPPLAFFSELICSLCSSLCLCVSNLHTKAQQQYINNWSVYGFSEWKYSFCYSKMFIAKCLRYILWIYLVWCKAYSKIKVFYLIRSYIDYPG